MGKRFTVLLLGKFPQMGDLFHRSTTPFLNRATTPFLNHSTSPLAVPLLEKIPPNCSFFALRNKRTALSK